MAEAPAEDKAEEAAAAAPEAATQPQKRRGRPKGLGKVPGSGRPPKPRTPADLRSHIIAELDKADHLIQIARGEEMRLSGPTGRGYLGRPTVGEQLKAWEILLRKALPDLTATTLDANLNGTIEMPAAASRDVARAVLDILRTAQMEKVPRLGDFEEAEEITDDSSGGVAIGAQPNGAAAVPAETAAVAEPTKNWIYSNGGNATNGLDRAVAARQAEMEIAPGERSQPGFGLPDANGMVAGERIMVKDAADREIPGWLEYRYMLGAGDGRESFWLVDRNGTRHASVLGREKAEAKLAELARTGKVTP